MTLVVEKWQEGWEGARISPNIACGAKKNMWKHVRFHSRFSSKSSKYCATNDELEASEALRLTQKYWIQSKRVRYCTYYVPRKVTSRTLFRNAFLWFSPATRMKLSVPNLAPAVVKGRGEMTLQTAEVFAPATQTCYSCARSWEETFLRDDKTPARSCEASRPLTATIRTPCCGHTLWGKYQINDSPQNEQTDDNDVPARHLHHSRELHVSIKASQFQGSSCRQLYPRPICRLRS